METDNSKKKIRRPGSGRTKGSFSFVLVTLADVLGTIANQTTPIPVSRKWAEALHLKTVQTGNVKSLGGKIDGTTPQTAVEAKVTVFED